MPAHFTPEALKFLRGISRHNDREWFEPRKPIYERELKAPMLALIGEINQSLATVAPGHVRDPAKCMMRIYRDTRFSADKKPYKTHVAAWWSRAGMEKTSGGGFYLHINAKEVTIAAGCYMPGPEQLLAIRRHLIEHHAELRALLANRKLRAAMSELEGHRLARPPRGFAADSPQVLAAMDLLLCRQWGVSARLPAETALEPSLLKEITARFALAAPIVAFLNAPLIAGIKRTLPEFGGNGA
jgi:uncharacterized protein (TIGR02453 family)